MAKLNTQKIRDIFTKMSGDNPKSAVEMAVECRVSNSRIWEVLHNVSVSKSLMEPAEYHKLLKKFHGKDYDEIVAKGQNIMDNRKAKAKERTEKIKALQAEQKAKEEAAVAAD